MSGHYKLYSFPIIYAFAIAVNFFYSLFTREVLVRAIVLGWKMDLTPFDSLEYYLGLSALHSLVLIVTVILTWYLILLFRAFFRCELESLNARLIIKIFIDPLRKSKLVSLSVLIFSIYFFLLYAVPMVLNLRWFVNNIVTLTLVSMLSYLAYLLLLYLFIIPYTALEVRKLSGWSDAVKIVGTGCIAIAVGLVSSVIAYAVLQFIPQVTLLAPPPIDVQYVSSRYPLGIFTLISIIDVTHVTIGKLLLSPIYYLIIGLYYSVVSRRLFG